MKVALIDDENVVLKGMSMVLGKEPDIEIVGTAANGIDGLELIRKALPDVVLTDIRMPGLTGLEMIEQAQKEFGDIVFIIFSGFNEFKYVQQAIGLGVLDYLEKPVTIPALKRVMDKARKMLEYRRNYRLMTERANKLNRVLVEQGIYKLLNEPQEREEECLRELQAVSDSLVYAGEIAVLCTGRLSSTRGCADDYRQMVNGMTFSVIENHSIEVFTLTVDANLYFVYFNMECELFDFQKRIEEAKEALLEQEIEFSAGLSQTCHSLSELRRAFSEAKTALVYGEFLEEEGVMNVERVEYEYSIPMDLSGSQYSLSLNFRLQNYEECRMQVENYIESLEKLVLLPEILRHECLELVLMLRNLGREAGFDQNSLTDKNLHGEIQEMVSAKEMIRWCKEKADELFALLPEKEESKEEGNPVKIVRRYIHEHYAESITLELLAEQVHMNPAYLSVLFKRDEGTSYSKYLTMVRMDQAKILLESGMKAKDVCEKVGYFDYRYFNKQFKQHTGMTPDTYKKSIHAGI
ncbi:MAG: response regulator [Eubacteriales bacterium]|nr:response regulator [Eubacteriales bacterium]